MVRTLSYMLALLTAMSLAGPRTPLKAEEVLGKRKKGTATYLRPFRKWISCSNATFGTNRRTRRSAPHHTAG